MKALGSILLCLSLIAVGVFAHIGYQQFAGPEEGPGGGRPRGGRASATDGRATPVEIATVSRSNVQERVSESGVLEPEREVTILARVEGQVEGIDVEEGDVVESGTALCAIDEQALRIAETLALVEKKHAIQELKRFEDLHAQAARVVSEQELQEARLNVERTTAAHEEAQLKRSYSRPEATFTGTIVGRFVEVGQYVRVGDPLFIVADFDPLLLKVHLPEAEVRRVQAGAKSELRGEDGSVISIGNVDRISPVVSRESLTVEVTIQFSKVPKEIRPGAYSRVDIISRTIEGALLVPRDAVVPQEGGVGVFRVSADGQTVELIRVETGYTDESSIEIRSTLSEGDRVVVAGNRNLTDGDRIRIFREQ